MLKSVRLSEDWIALRTCDVTGREALPLSEALLSPVWEVLACPYLAYAVEPGQVGLLMYDLSGFLLPDVREPLTEAQVAQTLRNALALAPADYEVLGIDPGLRPENLSAADYVRIARRVSACVR